MLQLVALLLLAHCAAGARKLRRNQASVRGAKSLTNTFPFNANEEAETHNENHEAREPSQSLDGRLERQGEEYATVDLGDVAAAGEKCIDKVERVEKTEYDDVKKCDQ